MSKVVSPISLRMNIKIGDSQSMQVDLYGEDGRLLSRIVKRVPTSNTGVLQNVKIPFEIPGAAELGRITVSSLDKKGRIQMLNSVVFYCFLRATMRSTRQETRQNLLEYSALF